MPMTTVKNRNISISSFNFDFIHSELYDVCELLHGDFESLKAGLISRTIDIRHDVLVTDLNSREATTSRDALCRAIYGRFFTWLVNRINDVLKVGQAW